MALTKVTGSVIKDSVSLSGNVSVGGTLTYQDVTNVDALGIGTFRTGINVSGGEIVVGSNIKIGNAGIITATELDISGDIDVDGHTNLDNVSISGVATATTFVGALTGTASGNPTLANGSNNRVITATGANALNGESTLTYNGNGALNVLGASGNTQLALHRTNANTTGTTGTIGFYASDGDAVSGLYALGDGDNEGAHLVFKTTSAASGTNVYSDVEERLRITSSGRFGLNRSAPHYAMHLSPADSETRIDLHMTNSTTGHNATDGVQFGYQNSAGAYIWNFENTDIYFGTTNSARLYIKATTGHVEPNTDGSQNLGASNKRWANIYTTDLQLSNEGKTNDVDGTWGKYTIQEGESDLFLINNRSGKKYKFNLTEVS